MSFYCRLYLQQNVILLQGISPAEITKYCQNVILLQGISPAEITKYCQNVILLQGISPAEIMKYCQNVILLQGISPAEITKYCQNVILLQGISPDILKSASDTPDFLAKFVRMPNGSPLNASREYFVLIDGHFQVSILLFKPLLDRSQKSLKIPESVYRRTDNTTAKRKSTKGQTTIYKTLHSQLMIE